MTYESSENSQHSGKPVELFKYIGTYQNFYYTSNTTPVDFQGPDDLAPNTYLPIPMRRSQVNVGTQNDDNSEITIDMPVTVDLVAIYGFQISPPDLFLIVYRQHNPGEYVRYWSGKVDNINVIKGTASIRVPSRLAQALSAEFPNVYYQGPCNHSLGDARCGIDMSLHQVITTVTAVAGKQVTLTTIGTLDGKLVGGEALLASGERRMIIAQAANVITVNYPFAGIELGDTIIAAEGCDLAYLGDCGTKFANQKRFGGFPFIPPKNIFATGLEPGKDISDEPCLPFVPEFDGWYLRFRGRLYRPDGLPVQNNRGTTNLTIGGPVADFNNSTSCQAYGSGTFSQCSFFEGGEAWKEWRYDYDVLAAISGASLHLQHQYPFNVHVSGVRIMMQYQRWFDVGWTTILGGTGSGTTYADGSISVTDLFPRDNYWTVPF